MEWKSLEHYDGKYYIGEAKSGNQYICNKRGEALYGPLMDHQLDCIDEVIYELDQL